MRVLIGILLILAAVAFLLFTLIPALTDDNQFALNIFEPVLCASGETLTAVREVGPTSDGGVGFTAYYSCTRANASSYDVTGRAWLIMGGGFVVLLLLGIGFLLSGRRRAVVETTAVYGGGHFAQAGRQNPMSAAPASAPDDIFNIPVDNKATMISRAPAGSAPDDLFNLPIDNKATMISRPPADMPLADGMPTMMSAKPAPAAQPETPQFDLQEKLRQLEEAYDHHLINREEYERKRDEILREF